MCQFRFNCNCKFEPSGETKEWWLYTHKTEHSFAGVKLPGLFQTSKFECQFIGFLGIFLLEGVATYWCSKVGVIITAILASIFVDLALAIVAHIFQKSICKMKNELVYKENDEKRITERSLRSTQSLQRFFYSLILLSAGFKICWFLSARSTPDATALFIGVCYFLGAILHITCTGYAIFTFIFKGKIKREYNKYLNSKSQAFGFDENNPIETELTSGKLKTVTVGHHEIIESDAKFLLKTLGVLTDEELWSMIARQDAGEPKRTLAIEGVEHQIKILPLTAKGNIKKKESNKEDSSK